MQQMEQKVEELSQLICHLTRRCNLKEDFFAASFNLSPTEVRLLRLFNYSVTYTVKELKDRLQLTSGRITHIISSLEKKKLIIRTQDNEDKRNVSVSLLPKAEPLINNLQKSYQDLHQTILQNIPESEIDKMTEAITLLVGVFDKWVDEKNF
jgi:DNA-binding MarR family transcriptional regulator